MAYCVKADLEDQIRDFNKLCPIAVGEGETLEEVATAWAARMIARADAYIDSRLSRRYGSYIKFDDTDKVPGGVPEIIRNLSIQITCYYCLLANYIGKSTEALESVKQVFWQPAIDVINWISKGNIEIPEIETAGSLQQIESNLPATATQEFRLARHNADGKTITEGTMEDW